jgi:N-acetylmuramoyl-L-alanine amidase
MVVLHYTAMASAEAAAERLCDPAYEVSAHYLIGPDGAILRLVPEALRAWHAGAGQWGGVTDVNSRSIGIELANTGGTPFAAAQMSALEVLLADILARRGIRPERVIAHSDMAPSRKGDPGPRFDWRRLALQGLSIWPDAVTAAASDLPLDLALTTIGYAPDLDPALALAAFRLRFRPWAQGPAGPGDLAAARNLAYRFPVDRFPVDRATRQA